MELTPAEQRRLQYLGGGQMWLPVASACCFVAGLVAIVMSFLEVAGTGERGILRFLLEDAQMGTAVTAGFWALAGLSCILLSYSIYMRRVSYQLLSRFEARVRELEAK